MTVQAHDSMLVSGPTVTEASTPVPVNAGTITLSPVSPIAMAITSTLVGTIASLTLTINDGIIPGQVQRILFTQIITALTCSGANLSGSILALPTAATANQMFEFVWSAANSYWVRVA